jgi:hypothetical protein
VELHHKTFSNRDLSPKDRTYNGSSDAVLLGAMT